MTNQGWILGAVLLSSAVAGCDAPVENDTDTLEFRSADTNIDPWWAPDLNYPGNGDIEVREGGGDDDTPDTIIWDIAGGISRQVLDGQLVERLTVIDNEIWPSAIAAQTLDAATPTCTVQLGDHPSGKAHQLVGADGDVIFTMWKRYVLVGDVDLPVHPKVKQNTVLQSQIAMSFKKKRIHAGAWWDGTVLAKADEKISKANPVRRLVLAALVAGECGSEGL